MKKILTILMLVAVFVAVSCDKTKIEVNPDKQAPHISSVKIVPAKASSEDSLAVASKIKDKENDPYILYYEWYINGEKIDVSAAKLSADYLEPGALVYVRIMAEEINEEGQNQVSEWKESKEIKILEKESRLGGVLIKPQKAFTDTDLQASVNWGKVDAGSMRLYYMWLVNGEEIIGEDTQFLDNENFEHEDEVQVMVNLNSDFDDPATRISRAVSILNSPPVIVSDGNFFVRSGTFMHHVEAVDKDGDYLTYFIDEGPRDARINEDSGEIRWRPAKGIKGEYEIIFGVEDGYGGEAFQSSLLYVERGLDKKEEREVEVE